MTPERVTIERTLHRHTSERTQIPWMSIFSFLVEANKIKRTHLLACLKIRCYCILVERVLAEFGNRGRVDHLCHFIDLVGSGDQVH